MISGTYVAGTKYTCAATITFADNTTKTLSESDFALGNNGFVDGAGASAFPLGVAIERSITIEIQNDGSYANKTFVGAQIQLSAKYGNNTIALGKFTVVEPETYGETIIISAVDDMYKAEKPFTTSLTFPVTLQQLFIDICNSCGIAVGNTSFFNRNLNVSVKPEKVSFRDVIGYIAMIAQGNARVDRNGQLQIMTYDLSVTPSATLSDWQTLKTDYNNVTITGLDIITGEGQEEVIHSYGSSGYKLELRNPFFTSDNYYDIYECLAGLIGMTFRKFEGDHVADPFIEFMDVVNIKDRKNNTYKTVITDVDFTFFGVTTFKNSAESALRNAQYYTSDGAKTLVAAQKAIQKETTSREAAIAALQQALTNASGMFSTDAVQPDHSVIRFFHDKQDLGESMNVIKITSEAIAFSTTGVDGPYTYGITLNGDTVVRLLSAEGVDADWITTGALTVRNNGTTVFQADCDTGSVSINGSAGNVQFTNCPFTTIYTKTFLASNYTSNDFTRLQNIILGTVTPTQSDYDKFDFNLDGVLDGSDFIRLRNMIMASPPYGNLSVYFIVNMPANSAENLIRVYRYEEYGDGHTNTVEIFSVSAKGLEIETPSWEIPTVYSSRCAVNSGGYSILGKKVEVSLEISIPSNLGTDASTYFWMLTGFPIPLRDAALSISKTNDTEGAGVYSACISDEGSTYNGVLIIRYNGKALVAGDKLAITGSYWAE